MTDSDLHKIWNALGGDPDVEPSVAGAVVLAMTLQDDVDTAVKDATRMRAILHASLIALLTLRPKRLARLTDEQVMSYRERSADRERR